ncbi:MAG TPA: hypothetical protein VIR54_26955 [Vicinamibacterales bacterium]
MTRVLGLAALVLSLATPAAADLTLKQTMNGKGMGVTGASSGTAYIKGNKMRSEMQVGDRTQIAIFDLDAQKMYSFDSKKKEADVWDMATFSAELAKTVDTSAMKASLTPNGQTKQINGQTATGYDLEISMPSAIGGNPDMVMTVTMTGTTWIVKDAPGTADYVNFYKAAAEKGWIFGDPRAAKSSPGQARATVEMYKQFADAGGIAYETDMQMKVSSTGGGAANPLGGLLARMGNMSMATTIQSIETGALGDDLFAPPAGYKLNQKK